MYNQPWSNRADVVGPLPNDMDAMVTIHGVLMDGPVHRISVRTGVVVDVSPVFEGKVRVDMPDMLGWDVIELREWLSLNKRHAIMWRPLEQ